MQTLDYNFFMSVVSSFCTLAAMAVAMTWPRGAAKWILGAALLADLFLAAIWQAVTLVNVFGLFSPSPLQWEILGNGTSTLRLVPQVLMLLFVIRCAVELRAASGAQSAQSARDAATPVD